MMMMMMNEKTRTQHLDGSFTFSRCPVLETAARDNSEIEPRRGISVNIDKRELC